MSYDKNMFQRVEKKPIAKAPAFSKTLQIDSVAKGSPAAQLKLKPGDKMLALNGKPALTTDIPALLESASDVTYRFFLPRESSFLEVSTKSLPLGLKVSASSDGIVDQYRAVSSLESGGLLTLWEREDYPQIRAACAIISKRMNRGNLFGKLLGKRKTYPLGELMNAICDVQAGQVEAGCEAIEAFANNDMRGETVDVHAVVAFERAMRAKSENDKSAYVRLMQSAHANYPESERIRREAVRAGIEIDKVNPRIGLSVKGETVFTFLEGGQGATSLANLIGDLKADQFQLVCLMPSYRGNGPYNDCLLTYISIYPHIAKMVAPMAILTDVAEKRPDRPHWNSHEATAKKANCLFQVLHGDMGEAMDNFRPTGAPEFYLLNKKSEIVWAGFLGTDFDYWDMLASAESLSDDFP